MTRISVGANSSSGLRWPNYVNGRLLTATDLRSEQTAVLERDRWLGESVGVGVAHGLEVSGSTGSSELHVSPGTGVCPGGTAVHLDAPATLDLTVVTTVTANVDGAHFADCVSSTTQTTAPTTGAYLLIIRPASSFAGKVPVLGPGGTDLPTPCASRWEVEEVAFSAIRLDGFTVQTTAANRRNRLAHWCFGSPHLDDLAMSGFTAPIPYRGLDTPAGLGPCDLPLAVFYWDGQAEALRFVDRWSARRRIVTPAATVPLAEVIGDGRTANGEARFLQFQEQLGEAVTAAQGPSIRALDVFPLLPPAGLVPIDTTLAIKPLLYWAQLVTQPKLLDMEPQEPMLRTMLATIVDDHSPGVAAARLTETGGGTFGKLGKLLAAMQKDIDELEQAVAALKSATGGEGGKKSAAKAKLEGRKLADWISMALATSPGRPGVDLTTFFAGIPVRFGVVDRETVDFTVRRSWYDEAVDLGQGATLNLFFVTTGDQTVAPYVLVTKRIHGIRWIDPEPRVIDQ